MALLAGIIWLILKWEWFSFAESARPRQSEKSMRKRAVYVEICDQFANQESVFYVQAEQIF